MRCRTLVAAGAFGFATVPPAQGGTDTAWSDRFGGASIALPVPGGVPPGVSLFVQAWAASSEPQRLLVATDGVVVRS